MLAWSIRLVNGLEGLMLLGWEQINTLWTLPNNVKNVICQIRLVDSLSSSAKCAGLALVRGMELTENGLFSLLWESQAVYEA